MDNENQVDVELENEVQQEEVVVEEKECQECEKETKKDKNPFKKKDKTNEELEKLKKELEQQKEQLLRVAAEYDNFRRRSQKERESVYGDAKAQTLSQILPVIDNFGRAANNTDATLEDYTKGVQMTFKQLTEILTKLGVEEFGEAGEDFDPQIHSAVMHIEDDEMEENKIAEVFQKGYRLDERILRHAMVKVAN